MKTLTSMTAVNDGVMKGYPAAVKQCAISARNGFQKLQQWLKRGENYSGG